MFFCAIIVIFQKDALVHDEMCVYILKQLKFSNNRREEKDMDRSVLVISGHDSG